MAERVGRVECALVARDLREPLAGTGPVATGWIAVEHPGPWTPRAPTRTELGPAVRHLDVGGVRLQLVRPVRRQAPLPRRRGHDVLLCHAAVDPGARWLERLHLDRLEELEDLDPTVVLSADPPGLGEPVDHDVWLVCTHARRDACCAVRGRTAAIALEDTGIEVWETTHTGGHRFAATAVVLPDGLSLGRLDDTDVADVAAALAAGELPVEHLRGRAAVERPAQAAEVALRRHLDRHDRDDVLPLGMLDGVETAAELVTRGERWVAHLRGDEADPARPVSDDADPTSPVQWTVTDWRNPLSELS